ncbi:NUDIX hydrolase [Cytobacillus sp. IB215316]|uniref:NUDIX hydrolase n=1 Tax=Cytobacillus sp. IB215316 TaxID=3097354 RepID=UPI002A133D62|nr:NUDIX hydrolase [Cytobacillus sp. IB215316]MDX8363513.1 NUDIX hydrolase [Cytobacillus sp. IB215316]
MKEWCGSAAICVNTNSEILMVKSKDSDAWVIPLGGIEDGESSEDCCIREVKEETGYDVNIMDFILTKKRLLMV